jgi:hypothetical protein
MSWEPQTIAQLLPGEYLKAGTLAGRKVNVTLSHWSREEVGQDKEMKTIAHFKGKKMGMVTNAINMHCLAAMFGTHVPDWKGKTYTIYATDKVMPYPGRKGEEAMCLRVYGAPHLERDLQTTFKVGRRKIPITLRRHGPPVELESPETSDATAPSK